MQVLIGIDVGSSGAKAVAIDEDCRVVAASATYSYATHYPQPGWAEQDPDAWVSAAYAAVRECVEAGALDGRDVAGLSVDGPAHNVALLDADDRIIRPTIHWSDLRSAEQAERLESEYGPHIFALTMQPVNPSWTLTQLLWLRENEPDSWRRLRRVLVTKDYVRHRLVGDYATDVYDAIGTQLYDANAERWSPELCGLLDFPLEWMPLVRPAQAMAGGLSQEAAAACGLPVGTPVAVGSGDSVVEAFGAGAIAPGDGIVKLGTAANVNLVTAQAQPSRQSLTYRHVVGEQWFTITATNSGTATMRWFRDAFCRHQAERARATGVSVYDLIGQLAANAPPGSEGLLFHPYLMGERTPYWDPHLRGDFIGISARHGLHHFARAMLEGVAFSLRDCLAAAEALGQRVNGLRLLGGGSRSRLWSQLLCNILGRPLIRPTRGDASATTAVGAALLACLAVGLFQNPRQVAERAANESTTLEPDPAQRTIYDEYHAVYRDVARDLTQHNHRLVQLAER